VVVEAAYTGGSGEIGPEAFAALWEAEIRPAFPDLRLLPPGDPGQTAGIIIEPFSCWESAAPEHGIPFSRTYLVPRETALAGRFHTSREACVEGREILVPPEEVAPPFVALGVDGLYVDDPAYPLVRLEGLIVRAADGSGETGPAGELIAALREKLAAALSPGPFAPPPDIVRIAAAGDLMLGRGAEAILLREGPRGLWGEAADYLREADLAAINLEGPISGRGSPAAKTYTFRFSPASAEALGKAGIDLVLLANNHAFDWGVEAFVDTLTYLERAGVAAVGAGLDEAAAIRPLVFQKGLNQVRVFGLASFPREASGWDGLSAAAGAREPGMLHAGRRGAEKIAPLFRGGTEGESGPPAALEVVLFHGGQEWTTGPDTATRRLYTGLIREGADLIIGSHPHIVQGFEWIEGKAVFWSLGNFVFAGMENTGGGDKGLLIRLGYWGKKLLYLEAFPLNLSGPRTDIAPREELEVFYRRSRELAGASWDQAVK
jgi:poly-gamma-glutamate synthesis protein (capsule biosynthesis protein)